jgi:hypothetical protein
MGAALALATCAGAAAPDPSSSVAARYPKLQAAPFGKGIFAHVKTQSTTATTGDTVAELVKNPYVAGTQISYSWADLEPAEGDYQWDRIEQDLEPWAKEGKKCWIEIRTAERRDREGKRGTPAWVYAKGVPKVGGSTTAPYPVFWNATYQKHWGSFVRALAKKFDGDPRIEFVSTGGYSAGHEPNLTASDNEKLAEEWRQAGFDGLVPGGTYLNKAIKPILKIFDDAFRKTPVAQTVHVRTDFDRAMNEYAASLGFLFLSNGFSVKFDAQQRGIWRDRREKYGVKTGFAEWGPAGRELSLEKRAEKKERKRAKREGQPVEKGRGPRDHSTMATLLEVYRRGIGDDSDPALKPASRISYLPLGDCIPEVESEEQCTAALKWASDRLEK